MPSKPLRKLRTMGEGRGRSLGGRVGDGVDEVC